MWGFTRAEQRAILFLLVTFGCGNIILWYRRQQPPPPMEQAWLDSLQVHAHRLAAQDTAKIIVPARAEPIDLNTATLEQLLTLPGVGEVLGERILDYRAQHGKFARSEDLQKVKGLGRSKLQALKDKICVCTP